MNARLAWLRAACLFAGSLLGLAGAELIARIALPVDVRARAHELAPDCGPVYELDDEIGFRPLAPGPLYDERGVAPNPYATAKPADHARVLFLGDSVTRRARIALALAAQVPSRRVEWWNAGVEAYDTRQEVAWYERRLRPLAADLVVLTVHPNDLDGTAVLFEDPHRGLVLQDPGARGTRQLCAALYRFSRLYRHWVARTTPTAAPVGQPQRMREALRDLDAMTRADGAALFVFAMPWAKAPGQWGGWERARYETVCSVVAELGVPWCDGTAALAAASSAGEVLDEQPGDSHHPSDALARHYAASILEALERFELLDGLGARLRSAGG